MMMIIAILNIAAMIVINNDHNTTVPPHKSKTR